MPIGIDNALGVHAQALKLRARRAELLASNLANADTPHFHARDLDFKSLLGRLSSASAAVGFVQTHARHLPGPLSSVAGSRPMYRIPTQPSLDGNTVEPQVEQSAFLQNALSYQASVAFLDARIQGLRLAIRGE